MKVQPVQPGQSLSAPGQCPLEAILGHAQPGAGGAGVVDDMALLGGALRIDTQADAFPGLLCLSAEPLQLIPGIEYDVIAIP